MRPAVLDGEVGERPHRVALDVVVGREREEVEGHLIAVELLLGLAVADRDDLGQVELERRGVAEQFADDADGGGVHHELA